MKALIAILVLVAAIFVGFKLLDYWDKVEQQKERDQQKANAQVDPRSLQGVPYDLEPKLQEAYNKGALGLKEWLEKFKHSPQIKDPRLAWVELDYVVLISRDNPVEAKHVFADVKARLSTESPVYPRVKLLEKTYE